MEVVTDSEDSKEPPTRRRGWLRPSATTRRVATTLGVLVVALGVAALVLSTPIESGQGTAIGGLAVLGGAALTFYSANLTRKQTSSDENAKLKEQQDARNQLHQREVIRDIQTRFSTSTAQLANEAATIRLAGVYSLSSLADDWYTATGSELASERDRQVCIDVLCAYLRRDTTGWRSRPKHDDEWSEDPDEVIVRAAVIAVLVSHITKFPDPTDAPSWRGARLDLSRAHLHHAHMQGADLSTAELRAVDLTAADLRAVTAQSANFERAGLWGANMSGGTFDGAVFEKARMHHAKLTSSYFSRARMEGAVLTGAECTSTYFVGTKLGNADFSDATLTQTVFDHATLCDADFAGATLTQTIFDNADLSRADFRGCDLSATSLQNVIAVDTFWPDGTQPLHATVTDADATAPQAEFTSMTRRVDDV